MNWWAKAAILQFLSRCPGGRTVYRNLQDLGGTSRLDIAEYWPPRQILLELLLGSGFEPRGSRVLEIGTGWHPVLPLVLYLLGADEVVTIDLNPWLTPSSLAEAASQVVAASDRISSELKTRFASRRVAEIQKTSELARSPSQSIQTLLEALNIRYLQPVDARQTEFPAHTFDCFIHSDVFEHIPPEGLHAIMAESKRLLRPSGVHAARINPSDHFSEGNPITSVNFLKYSQQSWRWIGGSGLAFHNRLRGIDHLRAFERAGFNVVRARTDTDQQALDALENRDVVLHADFSAYTPQELACRTVYVVARNVSNDLAPASVCGALLGAPD